MNQSSARSLAAIVFIVVFPLVVKAQDAQTVLGQAASSLGSRELRTVRMTASGSSYTDEGDEGARVYHRVVDWSQELDLEGETSRVAVVRASGTPQVESDDAWTTNRDTEWEERFDLWLVPHIFLEQAQTMNPRVEARTRFGVDYTVVSFEDSEGHLLEGFIDEDGNLARIETSIDEETAVEIVYMYYEQNGGFRFPGLIIRKVGPKPDLILSVRDVQPNAAIEVSDG